MVTALSLLTACGGNPKTTAEAEKFDYTVEQFADLQILRYRVPGFEDLSLKQKELVYYHGSGFAGQRHSFRPEWQV